MKVLVLGGCGFLGSHTCEFFKNSGWDVVAYDNLTKFEYARAGFKEAVRDYNLRYLEEIGISTIIADIRDIKMLRKASNHSDLIVNCAAQPAMTIAIEDPGLDFDVNVKGTLNVLEVCTEKNIPLVNCSTIHIYGNGLNQTGLLERPTRFEHKAGTIRETHEILTGSLSPLHASKRAIEIYTQAYVDTYDTQAACFRLTGIYGPRQFGGEDHGWVANFSIRTILNQPIKIFGTDKQLRDILYVEDAARAFLDWFNHGTHSGTYNVGGGNVTTLSIHELLDMLETRTGLRSPSKLLPKRHGDLWWFVTDFQKANDTFSWKPVTLPAEGLNNLLEWIESEKELLSQ